MFTVLRVYAKLFSRITESSLMEEEIPVRYVFVMLLAIADQGGLVVGTDVAIARRMNMPIEEFAKCILTLGSPDPDSNSKEAEGRRIIPSDGERGYQIVNYLKYRGLKDEATRKGYMRDYMRRYREKQPVNTCKLPLTSPSVSESASESASGKGSEEGKPKPGRPTVEEVKLAAAKTALPESEALKFFDYYESNGWKVGKNPMRSWVSALANWKRNWIDRGGPERVNGAKRSLTPIELSAVIRTKEERAAGLKSRFSSEVATGAVWQSPDRQTEYVALRKEIRELKTKLEAFA